MAKLLTIEALEEMNRLWQALELARDAVRQCAEGVLAKTATRQELAAALVAQERAWNAYWAENRKYMITL